MDETLPDEPSEGELEESETEALAEDDTSELQEDVPILDRSESKKAAGHAEKVAAKKSDESERDKPSKGELEVPETEDMAEDDPAMMKPPFSNESNDSSADIIVKSLGLQTLPAVPQEPPIGSLEEIRGTRIWRFHNVSCGFT